jgi:2-polyprenyl-3-methyl-5-hydroxy-6-metoxy-1,4-benzoquinol methylase
MHIPENYIEINKALWEQKTPVHVASEFYDVAGFLNGANTLKEIELNLLGDVKGKKILHLQCHFGLDTLSIARMGAIVTGVDFSENAIEKARELAALTGLKANFICCNIYELQNYLQEEFDIVFTSYGVLGWLPDMQKWAEVATSFLKPKGKFLLVEFHPVVWMFDNDFKTIAYSYFNKEAIIETIQGTYAEKDAEIEATEIGWNHPLSDVLSALLKTGLRITGFHEYDYSPYACFNEITEAEPGRYRIKHLGEKLPMVYAVEGERK